MAIWAVSLNLAVVVAPIHNFVRSARHDSVCLCTVHTPNQTSYANSFVFQHSMAALCSCWLIAIIQKCSVKFKLFCSGPGTSVTQFQCFYRHIKYSILHGECLRCELGLLAQGEHIARKIYTNKSRQRASIAHIKRDFFPNIFHLILDTRHVRCISCEMDNLRMAHFPLASTMWNWISFTCALFFLPLFNAFRKSP